MIKRLLFIAVVLGLGQIFIIFSLKNISEDLSVETFSLFGQTESNFQFIIVLMAAGILSDAIRKIANAREWKPEYLKYQSARFFSGLLLCPFALLFFINKSFLIFLIAPIIGLSGEYAFYGIGKPILGSLIALIRIIIPYGIGAVIAGLAPHYYLEVFILLLLATYILTGFMISRLLNTQYLIKPSIKAFRLYFSSINLGIVNVLFYLQGLGLMIFISLLFSKNFQLLGAAFIGLKFYAIFKGIIRIIHQALVREMTQLEECLTVDKLSMIIAFTFLAATLIFPHSTVSLLFGEQYLNAIPFFQIMALSCLIFSFCFGLATNAVLLSFDKKLLMICIVSSLFCISSLLIFSGLINEIYSVGLALLTGEVALSIGLLIMYYRQNILKQRVAFFIQNALVLTIPLFLKITFFSDSTAGLLICMLSYSIILFAINFKEFNSVKLKTLDY